MKTLPSKEALALKFVELLRADIGETDYIEVKRLNRTEAYKNCCASHNFCDANMVMLEAAESFGFGVPETDDEDVALWNAAWDFAKETYLS